LHEAGLSLDSDEIRRVNPDGWFYDDAAKDWRCELWAENWPAVEFFLQIKTQWIPSFNGPTGLNYMVLFHELDRRGLSRDEYDDLYGCLRVIEQTALQEIHR
jgi:hypothetical protein